MFFRSLAGLFELLTVLGGAIGSFLLVSGIMPGNSAIQTAATSATAVAFVALPYAVAGIFHRVAMRGMILAQTEILRGSD